MCKVSVLMPVYNAEKYLAEAIDSIIQQTFADWELVIINDGSTDRSEEIVHSFADPRIRYYTNEQNNRLIATLNKGLALCKGQYIARMDADDIAHPHRLERQVAAMDADSRLVLCGTDATVITPDGSPSGRIVNPHKNSLLQISLLFTNPFIHPSVMIRKDLLAGERFDADALHVEDFDLWMRLADKGHLANIDAPLLQYRWHDSNVSVTHAARQQQMKEGLVCSQLARQLQIVATNEEISIHRLTFDLYQFGKRRELPSGTADQVADWFARLSAQNRKVGRYSPSDFDALLWSRWIVLCLFVNKKSKIFFPRFIRITPVVIFKTIKLALYLSRK